MVSTRRSARRCASRPAQPKEAPTKPVSSGAAQPTVLLRGSREASLHRKPSPAREVGGSQTVVAIPNDKALNQPVEAEKNGRKGKERVVVEGPDEMDWLEESLEESPSWLPDGWIVEAHKANDGSIHWYYTSPISGYTFSSKAETLHYLFSGMDERFLESKACAEHNELHRSHTWLPDGWMIEIRAGGKEMDKMYKFYVHLPTGKRFLSKGDVLRYANEGDVSSCDMDVLCDTSTDANVLAHLEFNPDGLPDGWVKEVIFRPTSSSYYNDGVRKDPYYTDPVSRHVFRTLRSAQSYLKGGDISSHAYIPRRSVTDLYSFDICADLPQSLLKRLRVEGQKKQKSLTAPVFDTDPNGQTSNHSSPSPLQAERWRISTIKLQGFRYAQDGDVIAVTKPPVDKKTCIPGGPPMFGDQKYKRLGISWFDVRSFPRCYLSMTDPQHWAKMLQQPSRTNHFVFCSNGW